VEVLLDSLRALEMSFGDLWTPDIASGKLTRPISTWKSVLFCAARAACLAAWCLAPAQPTGPRLT